MLISFNEEPEIRPGFPCTAFRWTFQIKKDFIGFVYQSQSNKRWHDSHTRVFGIFYHGIWDWGVDHYWYDGPHCLCSVGPFRIQWYNETCKECYGED